MLTHEGYTDKGHSVPEFFCRTCPREVDSSAYRKKGASKDIG